MKLGYGTTSWPVLGLCGVPNSQVFLCSIDAEFAVRIWDTQSQSCLLVYKIQHALSSTSSTHLCAILRTTPIANGFHLVAYIKNTSIKNPVHYIILKILNSDSRTFSVSESWNIPEHSFSGEDGLAEVKDFQVTRCQKEDQKTLWSVSVVQRHRINDFSADPFLGQATLPENSNRAGLVAYLPSYILPQSRWCVCSMYHISDCLPVRSLDSGWVLSSLFWTGIFDTRTIFDATIQFRNSLQLHPLEEPEQQEWESERMWSHSACLNRLQCFVIRSFEEAAQTIDTTQTSADMEEVRHHILQLFLCCLHSSFERRNSFLGFFFTCEKEHFVEKH